MNMQTILIGLVFSLVNVLATQCGANFIDSSTLPKTMPAEIEISFNSNGGMTRAGTNIHLAGNQLEFEELKASAPNPVKWTARISQADMESLYQVFVANNFDLIKNDVKMGTVYDAGSEGIRLSLGQSKDFRVSYGANSPLSGVSLKRYKAVSDAIHALASQYISKQESVKNTGGENYAVFPFDLGRYKSLLGNAKPAELDEDDIAAIEDLLTKAVDEYNSKQKEAQKINLTQYKRQIVAAMNKKGEKQVWVNCFDSDFKDWRKQIFLVLDGGKYFFNLKINLTTKKVYDFVVNNNP